MGQHSSLRKQRVPCNIQDVAQEELSEGQSAAYLGTDSVDKRLPNHF